MTDMGNQSSCSFQLKAEGDSSSTSSTTDPSLLVRDIKPGDCLAMDREAWMVLVKHFRHVTMGVDWMEGVSTEKRAKWGDEYVEISGQRTSVCSAHSYTGLGGPAFFVFIFKPRLF